jgi:signal transduction histidine kinase
MKGSIFYIVCPILQKCGCSKFLTDDGGYFFILTTVNGSISNILITLFILYSVLITLLLSALVYKIAKKQNFFSLFGIVKEPRYPKSEASNKTNNLSTIWQDKNLLDIIQNFPLAIAVSNIPDSTVIFSKVAISKLEQIFSRKIHENKQEIKDLDWIPKHISKILYKNHLKIVRAEKSSICLIQNVFIKDKLMSFRIEMMPFFASHLKDDKYILTLISETSEQQYLLKNKKLRERLKEERELFSNFLHDDLGSLLAALNLFFSMYLRENNKITNELFMAKQLTQQTIELVRNKSQMNFYNSLEGTDIYGALRGYIKIVNSFSGLKITLKTKFLRNKRFERRFETDLYFSIKELISNTLKHADAKTITINLIYLKNTLYLSYTDDGLGMNPKTISIMEKQSGLLKIKERMMNYNAKWAIITKENSGFKFKAIIPCKNEQIN